MKKIVLYSPETFLGNGLVDIRDEKKKFFTSRFTATRESLNLIYQRGRSI
jgi:hypothetical protein